MTTRRYCPNFGCPNCIDPRHGWFCRHGSYRTRANVRVPRIRRTCCGTTAGGVFQRTVRSAWGGDAGVDCEGLTRTDGEPAFAVEVRTDGRAAVRARVRATRPKSASGRLASGGCAVISFERAVSRFQQGL